MTTSLASALPPELLLLIFTQLSLLDYDDSTPPQDSLKHASLVSRSWSDPAQSILWQSGATLQGDRDVERWISTKKRRRCGPKQIKVYDLKDGKSLVKLWEHVEGIENLEIVSPGLLVKGETFDHQALADIRELTLNVTLLPTKSTTILPFRNLFRLVLADSGIQCLHQSSFLDSISRSSSSTTLKYLVLGSTSTTTHERLANSILPFTSNLRHLGLNISTSREDTNPYNQVISSCQRLKSFECTSLPLNFLDHLPRSLKGLATQEDVENISIERLKLVLLGSDDGRLRGVERLYFGCLRRDFEGLRGGKDLMEELERERGVEWYFAEDY